MSLPTAEGGTVESDAEDELPRRETAGSSGCFSKEGKTVESEDEDEFSFKKTKANSGNFSKDGKTVESDDEDEFSVKKTKANSGNFSKDGKTVESDDEDEFSAKKTKAISGNFSKEGKTVESDDEDEFSAKKTKANSVNFSKEGKTVESDDEDEFSAKKTEANSVNFSKEGKTVESDEDDYSGGGKQGTSQYVRKDGDNVESYAKGEGKNIKDATTIEDDPEDQIPLSGNDACLVQCSGSGKTTTTTPHAKVRKSNSNRSEEKAQGLCVNQQRTSRLRSSETFEEHDGQSGAEVSLQDDVFVQGPTSLDNKMGLLREQIEDCRVAETIDETPFLPLPRTEVPGRGTGIAHQIILKVTRVINDSRNEGSPIQGLPMEPLLRNNNKPVLFGRGEGVDIFLHDMLASKRHMYLDVVSGNPFKLSIRNVSDKKCVIVNDRRKIKPGQQWFVQNNDTITIGCTTFLVEIAQGDTENGMHVLRFYNLTDDPSPIPRGPRAELQHRPDIVQPQVSVSHAAPSLAPLGVPNSLQYDPAYRQPVVSAGPHVAGHYMTPGQYPMQYPMYPPASVAPQTPVFQNVYQPQISGYNTNHLIMAGYPVYAPHQGNYGHVPMQPMFSQAPFQDISRQMNDNALRMQQYPFSPPRQANQPVQNDETQEGRQEVDKSHTGYCGSR